LRDVGEEIKDVIQEIETTEKESRDQEILSKLKKSHSNLETIVQRHQDISEQWRNAVQDLKELVELFGMFNTPEEDLLDFFHTMQHFVGDYKNALNSNKKLFAPITEEVKAEVGTSAIKRRSPKEPSSSGNAHTDPTRARKRRSVGPISAQIALDIVGETGQPRDFVESLTNFGTTTPSPPRKDAKDQEKENKRRRKSRTSQNFDHIERERQ